MKYWVKESKLAFGFFFYYTLDMVICTYLVSIFGMKIWHPTTEAEVDELELLLPSRRVSVGCARREVMQCFPGVDLEGQFPGQRFTNLLLFNEKILHLVEDFFLALGIVSSMSGSY